jgi:dihydroorotate dehydrogenase
VGRRPAATGGRGSAVIHRLIISAPFGNWLHWPGTTPTLGTFTRHHRGGLLYRLWRCLRTLRPCRGGWVNRLGLPNPGIDSLPLDYYDGKIISIHGFNEQEWLSLIKRLPCGVRGWVEFNLSCPNVGTVDHSGAVNAAEFALAYGTPVIAKLPPVRWLGLACAMYASGVRTFHCCNTLPVPGGGLSGPALKPYSLTVVRALRQRWGDGITLIAGGGVYGMRDALDYLDAGADHVAIASVLLNPFNWHHVARIRDSLNACYQRDPGLRGLRGLALPNPARQPPPLQPDAGGDVLRRPQHGQDSL